MSENVVNIVQLPLAKQDSIDSSYFILYSASQKKFFKVKINRIQELIRSFPEVLKIKQNLKVLESSFFKPIKSYSEYFDSAPDENWLEASSGTWYSRTQYPEIYDFLASSLDHIKVVDSTSAFDDFQFVVNFQSQSFRLPRLNQTENANSGAYQPVFVVPWVSNTTSTTSHWDYQIPYTGYINLHFAKAARTYTNNVTTSNYPVKLLRQLYIDLVADFRIELLNQDGSSVTPQNFMFYNDVRFVGNVHTPQTDTSSGLDPEVFRATAALPVTRGMKIRIISSNLTAESHMALIAFSGPPGKQLYYYFGKD